MDRRTFNLGVGAVLLGPAAASGQAEIQRRPARILPAKYLIAFLHGAGGNGADAFPLAARLQAVAPTAALTVPDGTIRTGVQSFNWLTRQDRDGTLNDATSSLAKINALLDAELKRVSLPPEKLILIGFSQGSNASLNVGLRRPVRPAAIIAFAGPRVDKEGIPNGSAGPQVLMIQGVYDDARNKGEQAESERFLKARGFSAQAHLLPGLGHSIDERGLKLASEFLRNVTA